MRHKYSNIIFRFLSLPLMCVFILTFSYADNELINNTCPGEIIEEINGVTNLTNHVETGYIINSGQDIYQVTLPEKGKLDIYIHNTNSTYNGGYFFYVGHSTCGTWDLVNADYGTSQAYTVNVNGGETIYIRLQANGERQDYGLDLTFMPEGLPNKSISINDVSITEGDTGTKIMGFTITATDNPKGGETVSYSIHDGTATVADGDYGGTLNGSVVFKAGEKTVKIEVEIQGDVKLENNENFVVELTGLSGSVAAISNIYDAMGIGTILDDEPSNYALVIDSAVINEAVGTYDLSVRVDPAMHDNSIIKVNYATVSGTATAGADFSSTSGTLTITQANTVDLSTIVSIPLTINNDTISEPQELFSVKLSNASISSTLNRTVSIANDTGSIMINDDDTIGGKPTISVNDVTVIEGDNGEDKKMIFTVSISEIQTSEVTFGYATSPVTATADVDYTTISGTAKIPPNTQNITIPVTIKGDLEAGEGNEILELHLTMQSAIADLGKSVGIGTIIDNDTGLTLALYDAYITEKDFDVPVKVRINLSEPLSSDLNVTYSTQNGSALAPNDYNGTSVPQHVIIPAGSSEYFLEFMIKGDDLEEDNEKFTVTIDSVSNSSITVVRDKASVIIFDDDAQPGCSTYIGMLTINEYQNNPNYKDDYGHPLADNSGKVPGNYIEIKYLDQLVKQYILQDAANGHPWTLGVYTTAGIQILTWDRADSACVDPRYDIFQMDNNVMGAQGYVVVLDGNGNEVDVLNIDNSSHYSQQCHDFLYDTTFDSSAQNKDIYRDPDGIGDWYDVGSGANSGGSRCINREGDSGLLFTRFDAIDIDENIPTKITGSESVPIKTKVANQPFDLNIISLDPETGELIKSNLAVRTYLADAVTGERLPIATTPVIVTFNDSVSVVGTGYNYPAALQMVRLRFEYCGNDLGAYESWDSCWDVTTGSDEDIIIAQSNRRVSHSRDIFALRPDKFTPVVSGQPVRTDNSFTILKAGVTYTMSLTAPDGAGSNSVDYNQSGINIENTPIRFLSNGSPDDGTLRGDMNISDNFNFIHGVATPDVQFQYSDVGDVDLQIEDRVWASVDNDDTPMDCLSSSHTYVCGDFNTTMLPDHFEINATAHNHRDGNFTYMTYANDMRMAARLEVNITAMNAQNKPTLNFKNGDANQYYENPVQVTFNVPTKESDGTDINSTSNILSYAKNDIASPMFIGFSDGKRTIAWNEANVTTQLRFGYNKYIDSEKSDPNLDVRRKPFDVNASNIKVQVSTIYTFPTTSGLYDLNISSDHNASGMTRFYYAGLHPQLEYYENITDTSVLTPVSVSVYCPQTAPCSVYGLTSRIDSTDWLYSLDHKQTLEDGVAALMVQKPPLIEGAGAPTVNNVTNPGAGELTIQEGTGTDENVIVGQGAGASLPMTLGIHVYKGPYTDPWLVYEGYDDPLYKVRFVGPPADWQGVGTTGHAIDVDISTAPTNRMDW